MLKRTLALVAALIVTFSTVGTTVSAWDDGSHWQTRTMVA